MKKEGFTLVELLAVIVIIGIIYLIVFPSVTSFIDKSKEKSYNIQVDLIEKASKKWVIDNTDELLKKDPYHLNNINLTLTTLKKDGYLQDEFIENPKTKKIMTGCVVVSYQSNKNQYEYTYEDGKDTYSKDDTKENKSGELVWDNKNFVVFTDTNGKVKDASTYQSNGPKEEVYLAQGQSVSFSLANWDANVNHLYLGIKAPMRAGTVQLGDKSVAVNNTVDCYYDVAKFAKISEVNGVKVATLTITNPSDKIISLTNIKVTGTPDFVIIPEKNADNVGKDEAED